ncbi:MAG: hypothetical protein IAC58_01950 [Firmicutes bacterium]|uniref:Uncharacterized protein n=1 Tax=Candidatus Onthovivens merdipullorum TaxID=2840889 RepID=A0A9D9DGL9_9BACL|nr:hypothetical protein [Candidatus Onthovivens merdipullorum]
MKLANDEKIKKIVKENSNYQIKTTSEEILNTYRLEQSINKNKVDTSKTKKKKFLMVSIPSLTGALALGAVLLVVFLPSKDNINDNPGGDVINPPIIDPSFVGVSDSTELTSELLTFSTFNNSGKYNTTSLNKFRDRNNVTQEDFDTIINEFDNTYFGVSSLFSLNNTKVIDENFNSTINNETYLYKSSIYINDNTLIGTFYYNNLTEFTEEDETNSYLKGLYVTNNLTYTVYLNNEIELEHYESEQELEALFININDSNDIYKVSKESETEGQGSENSYSYEIYETINDIYNEDNYVYKVQYSIETTGNHEEIELEITRKENRTEHTYTFQDILKVSDNVYTFYAEYENERTDEELEFFVTLTIENANRIYTSGNFEKIF